MNHSVYYNYFGFPNCLVTYLSCLGTTSCSILTSADSEEEALGYISGTKQCGKGELLRKKRIICEIFFLI